MNNESHKPKEEMFIHKSQGNFLFLARDIYLPEK